MQTYEYVVRETVSASEQRVLGQGTVQASRAPVAAGRAAEAMKNQIKPGQWVHVSIKRVS